MQNNFINPGDIEKREIIILPRNEQRHRESIIYLLDLLKTNGIDIPDESLKDYLDKRFFDSELGEEKNMNVYMKNDNVHRSVISFLNKLLQSNNIDITDESQKDYLSNIHIYDCQWKDYRKESGGR
ncbi:MAG: hypothetical protein PHX04_01150 [Bacilli bacterium]|nr:hypothetical protein [Bacilli bacterium]